MQSARGLELPHARVGPSTEGDLGIFRQVSSSCRSVQFGVFWPYLANSPQHQVDSGEADKRLDVNQKTYTSTKRFQKQKIE